jgi:DNA polymerase-3 subunit beta
MPGIRPKWSNTMETLVKIEAKALAALHPFTAKKDVRYYLDGVYIEPGSNGGAVAVATDGHKILVVTDLEATITEPVIIQFESTLATQMKRKDAGIATVSRISPDNLDLLVTLQNGHIGPARIVEGTYPAYKNVIPEKVSDNPCAMQHYNPQYVIAFCTAEKVLRSNCNSHGISLVNGEQKSPVCIMYPHISDTLHALGVLMPLVQKEMTTYSWQMAA